MRATSKLQTILRMNPSNRRKYVAEIFGTFALVFAGTGAIVINDLAAGAITHPGIALTFGLIVLAMIYTTGDISGAHLNPAVTIAFWVSGRFQGRFVVPYLLSQLGGALAASLMLRLLFPTRGTLGGTFPAGSPLQSFGLELILTGPWSRSNSRLFGSISPRPLPVPSWRSPCLRSWTRGIPFFPNCGRFSRTGLQSSE